MTSPDAARELLALAGGEDGFSREGHRLIARAVAKQIGSDGACDPAAIFHCLIEEQIAEEAYGGGPYLATLYGGFIGMENARWHARKLAQLARDRHHYEAILRARQAIADGRPADDTVLALRAELDRLNGHGPSEFPRPQTALELLQNPPDAVARILEPSVIVAGGITVIAAPTKVGKTNFWTHIAYALTEGRSLWRHFTFAAPQPVPVLMIQLELSKQTMHERLGELSAELSWSSQGLARFSILCERSLLIDTEKGLARLEQAIEACAPRPEFVIIDSYNAAVAGDPDKSGEARKAIANLRRLQARTGVTLGLTSEIRKSPTGERRRWTVDELKGNNELAYDADAALLIRPLDEEDRSRLSIHFAALRHGDAPASFVLERRGLTFQAVGEHEFETPSDLLQERMAAVIRVIEERGTASKRVIRRTLGGRASMADAALDFAIESGHVEWSPKGFRLKGEGIF